MRSFSLSALCKDIASPCGVTCWESLTCDIFCMRHFFAVLYPNFSAMKSMNFTIFSKFFLFGKIQYFHLVLKIWVTSLDNSFLLIPEFSINFFYNRFKFVTYWSFHFLKNIFFSCWCSNFLLFSPSNLLGLKNISSSLCITLVLFFSIVHLFQVSHYVGNVYCLIIVTIRIRVNGGWKIFFYSFVVFNREWREEGAFSGFNF